jgi:hypothetical protein
LSSAITTPPLPWTLANLHYVDFRASNLDPIEQLIWGITGEKPATREKLAIGKDGDGDLKEPFSGTRLYPPLFHQHKAENAAQLEILRRRVKEYWVDGVLKHSLYNEVLISLGKRDADEFVNVPWKYKAEVSNAIGSVSFGRSRCQLHLRCDGLAAYPGRARLGQDHNLARSGSDSP